MTLWNVKSTVSSYHLFGGSVGRGWLLIRICVITCFRMPFWLQGFWVFTLRNFWPKPTHPECYLLGGGVFIWTWDLFEGFINFKVLGMMSFDSSLGFHLTLLGWWLTGFKCLDGTPFSGSFLPRFSPSDLSSPMPLGQLKSVWWSQVTVERSNRR